jgi:hypothetical protein
MVLVLGVAALSLGLYMDGPTTLTILLAGVTLAYLLNLTLTAILAMGTINKSPEEQFGPDLIKQLEHVSWPH